MNKPSFINLRPFLNTKVVDLKGISFTNKQLIQAAIYLSPTIMDQLLGGGECNSIVCSINPIERNIIVNFMTFSQYNNNLVKDMRHFGIIDQDAYDNQIVEVNSSCCEKGVYTFALTTGFVLDNFNAWSNRTTDQFVVLVPMGQDCDIEIDEDMTLEELEESMEDFENSILTETIIIPFEAIENAFDEDPEID